MRFNIALSTARIFRRAFSRGSGRDNRLLSVLACAPDGVIGVDGAGTVSFWNPRAETIFGYKEEEALGRPVTYFIPQGIGESTGQRAELKVKDRAGRDLTIEICATTVRGGRSSLVAAFVRDITEQRRVARDLILKSDVLENSLNGFDIVSHRGEFTYANRTYLDMWGYGSLDEIIGTSPAGHCADPEIPGRIIRTLKEKGECNLEFLARRKDGSTFHVHMWARLAHDAEGNEIYPTTSIDITERKRAEMALKEAVRARDEFISVCSHELKTPLTSMKMQFQMAERQMRQSDSRALAEDAVRKRIANSNRQLDRMTRLIDEMLDVTRLSEGRTPLESAPEDFCALVRDSADRLAGQFEAAGVRLELNLPERCIACVDRYRMEQVVSNLLTNALKYGAGKPVRVSVTHEEGGPLRLVVADSGEGIAPENQERIFQRFERASASKNVTGLGLGLYICQQIVEAHGGTIRVQSEPGKGSAFMVAIP